MTDREIETLRDAYRLDRQGLFRYALSVVGNREAAEDAVHSAVQRVLRLERLPVELRPYLFRCVRNAAVDALRQTRLRTDSLFRIDPPAELSQPPAALAADVATLLEMLTADERETILLKIYEGFTFQQIADVTAAPLPTVSSWYRRGLEKMRAALKAAHEA